MSNDKNNVFSTLKARLIHENNFAEEALLQLPEDISMAAARFHDSHLETTELNIGTCEVKSDNSSISLKNDTTETVKISMDKTITANKLSVKNDAVEFNNTILGLISTIPVYSMTGVLGWCCDLDSWPESGTVNLSAGCINSHTKNGNRINPTFTVDFEQYLQTAKEKPIAVVFYYKNTNGDFLLQFSTTVGTTDDIKNIGINADTQSYLVLILGGENNRRFTKGEPVSSEEKETIPNADYNIFKSNQGRIIYSDESTEDIVLQLHNDPNLKSTINIGSLQLTNSEITTTESEINLSNGIIPLDDPLNGIRLDSFTGDISGVNNVTLDDVTLGTTNMLSHYVEKAQYIDDTYYTFNDFKTTYAGYPGALLGMCGLIGTSMIKMTHGMISDCEYQIEGHKLTVTIDETCYDKYRDMFQFVAIWRYKDQDGSGDQHSLTIVNPSFDYDDNTHSVHASLSSLYYYVDLDVNSPIFIVLLCKNFQEVTT